MKSKYAGALNKAIATTGPGLWRMDYFSAAAESGRFA
jgi:hypothetical protein